MSYYHWLGRKAEKYHGMSPAAVNTAMRELIADIAERDGFKTIHPKL